MKGIVVVLLFAIALCAATDLDLKDEEQKAKEFLEKLNDRTAKRNNRVALANWAYASNISDANLQQQVS